MILTSIVASLLGGYIGNRLCVNVSKLFCGYIRKKNPSRNTQVLIMLSVMLTISGGTLSGLYYGALAKFYISNIKYQSS